MSLSAFEVSAAASVPFNNGGEIVGFFADVVKAHFVDWFNAKCANRDNWKSRAIGSSAEIKDRFLQIWNSIPLIFQKSPINLIQFSALMSIFINEVGAQLLPVSELCGHSQFPGLAYPFSVIPGVKQSYNAGGLNKLAGDLFFSDEHYWAAHNSRPGANLVRAAPASREQWNGQLYPQQSFSTSLDPQQTGFIQQADFFKFRGRGFIQATWRANYALLVRFIQGYAGNHPTISHYRDAWAQQDPDVVCTISTNEDWDKLFLESNGILACRAIGIHNQSSGNYLNLSTDPDILQALTNVPGSLFNMGLRISGGRGYASLFSQRAVQLIQTLAYTG